MSETAEPRRRVEAVITQALALPQVLPGIIAIALVGSWARNAARADSDVDLIVLTDQPWVALRTTKWISVFGVEVDIVRTADFGAVQERRLRLPNGLVVEVGIGVPSWADTEPLDPGTERVVLGGLVPLHDPRGLLSTLLVVTHRR